MTSVFIGSLVAAALVKSTAAAKPTPAKCQSTRRGVSFFCVICIVEVLLCPMMFWVLLLFGVTRLGLRLVFFDGCHDFFAGVLPCRCYPSEDLLSML